MPYFHPMLFYQLKRLRI